MLKRFDRPAERPGLREANRAQAAVGGVNPTGCGATAARRRSPGAWHRGWGACGRETP